MKQIQKNRKNKKLQQGVVVSNSMENFLISQSYLHGCCFGKKDYQTSAL